jgi:hypothetical protein
VYADGATEGFVVTASAPVPQAAGGKIHGDGTGGIGAGRFQRQLVRGERE